MVNGQTGPVACQSGTTNIDGFFAITCPLSDVMAGKAKVWCPTLRTTTTTLIATRTGPSKPNLTCSPTPRCRSPKLDRSNPAWTSTLHQTALDTRCCTSRNRSTLTPSSQSNGQAVGGKCLNIYMHRDENVHRSPPCAPATPTAPLNGSAAIRNRIPRCEVWKPPAVSGRVRTPAWRLNRTKHSRWLRQGQQQRTERFRDGHQVLVRSRVDLQVKQT